MYIVTITKTEAVEKLVHGDWVQGGSDRSNDKTGYGYAPTRTLMVDTTTQLLSQTLEEIDLPAVIKAINNL